MVVVGKKERLGEGRETRRPFGVWGSEFQILKKDRRVFYMTRSSTGGRIGHKELRSHLKPFRDDFESTFSAIASIFLDEGREDDTGEDGVNGEDVDSDNDSDDGGEVSDNGEADGEGEGVCSEDE
jgi:hypothetical protein